MMLEAVCFSSPGKLICHIITSQGPGAMVSIEENIELVKRVVASGLDVMEEYSQNKHPFAHRAMDHPRVKMR